MFEGISLLIFAAFLWFMVYRMDQNRKKGLDCDKCKKSHETELKINYDQGYFKGWNDGMMRKEYNQVRNELTKN